MAAERFVLDTHDGTPVVVHRWEPSGEARAVVNLVHGMAEHAARYDHVASALTDAGFAVYAEDHRGHGETARSDDDLGYFASERGWAKVLQDVHRVTLRARADHHGVPLFLLGHSMGSFLGQQYLFTYPGHLDGAVLSGSNGPVGPIAEAAAVIARAERLRLGAHGRSPLLHKLTFGTYNQAFEPARTGFDWLSRDPAVVDAYVDDPRCGFVATTQFYLDLFSGLRVIQQKDRLSSIRPDLPLYLFAGEDDPVGGRAGVGKLTSWYQQAGLTGVEQRIYPGGRHEMLNETNRDEVVADLLAWLTRQLDRLAAVG